MVKVRMIMDRIADFRQVFAQIVVTRAGGCDPSIREAFARVPRHEFVGPGPWQLTEHGDVTPSDDPALVYQDIGMGLAPERGIPTGLPSLHARCLAACAPKPGDHVVHIGAGTGYYTAILAEMVGADGRVNAFELDAPLAARASDHLSRWPWAHVELSSGARSTLGEVDLIYVSAGVQQPPRTWLDALRAGGRLLFPLTPGGEEGGMLLVSYVGSRQIFSAEFICRARFFPCIGTQDEEISACIAKAFASGGHELVRSLRLDPEQPDDSAWVSGRGWWLSTNAAEPTPSTPAA
jgi:protein-L-isoaspartate(D-aspartate) O-methyltransferase